MDGEVFPWHHSRYKKEVWWRGYMWHQGLTLTRLAGRTSKINLGLFTEIRQDANEQRSRRDKRRATNTALKKTKTFLCKWPKPKTTCGKNMTPSKTQETLPTHLSIQICRTRSFNKFYKPHMQVWLELAKEDVGSTERVRLVECHSSILVFCPGDGWLLDVWNLIWRRCADLWSEVLN